MAECTIQDLREDNGCPANLTIKQINWAQLQMLCSINDWIAGDDIEACDFDALIEEGRCSTASVVELEYWKAVKLCELVSALSSGGISSVIVARLTFPSRAALRAFTDYSTTLNGVAFILGADAIGDGGDGAFWFSLTSTDADNGGTILKPDNIAVGNAGRWIRFNF